ncbi:hypothetical protein [Nocardia terpenica]|uniref:Scaffolding protein n=1 Tax=Nocardia terpenica TaxID=455432 RepID=A0A164H236_9NOCA|nr:hypothetical protein [Nocardia terpenica]KZM68136.1 hypothetical protein AWN90_09345 [Nocardia terpenica]NQE89006.1 hypothetical protein [Nocardia terpenica]
MTDTIVDVTADTAGAAADSNPTAESPRPNPPAFQGKSTPGAGDDADPPETAEQLRPEAEPKTFSADYVQKLRSENAKLRTEFRDGLAEARADAERAAQEAADRSRHEMAESIGKALGLIEDDKPVDPAELVAQAEQKRQQAQAAAEASAARARAMQVELALYRAAEAAGVDSGALLDSRSFMARVEGLDPGAADFGDRIAEHIVAAVDANPGFKRPAPRTTPARSGGDMSGGNGDPSGQEEYDVNRLRQLRTESREKGRAGGGVTRGMSTPVPPDWVMS